MKTSKEAIRAFLETRKLAIAGVSRDPKKFGFAIMKKLKEIGFDLYLVHPDTDTLHGESTYRNISDLPGDIGSLLILTPKTETFGVVEAAVKKVIPNLWIQQMSETPESIEYAVSNKVNLVCKQCIFMFTEPVDSIHKFHRTIRKFFGMMPR